MRTKRWSVPFALPFSVITFIISVTSGSHLAALIASLIITSLGYILTTGSRINPQTQPRNQSIAAEMIVLAQVHEQLGAAIDALKDAPKSSQRDVSAELQAIEKRKNAALSHLTDMERVAREQIDVSKAASLQRLWQDVRDLSTEHDRSTSSAPAKKRASVADPLNKTTVGEDK